MPVPCLAGKNLKIANSNLRGITLSLLYLCLMSPFTLHGQHGLQTACEPTNLRKKKITNVSYFNDTIHIQHASSMPS